MSEQDLLCACAALSRVPWAAELINDPNNLVSIPDSRQAQVSGRFTYFGRTLNTPDTITHFVTVRPKRPGRIDELKGILTLGDGFNGHPNVCHGGILTTILDEMMGLMVVANLERNAIPGPSYMTAYLNTTYVRPLPAQSTVLAVARIARLEGRKLFITETLEDGKGGVYAKTEGLFVRLREKL